MQDYYTTEQLKDRGWTSLMIKAHLGKPMSKDRTPMVDFGKPSNFIGLNASMPPKLVLHALI